jgi:hypothetical protein
MSQSMLQNSYRRVCPRQLLSLLLFASALLVSQAARAEKQISLDVEAALPANDGHDDGWGLGARVGNKWDLVLVSLTPEVGFNYHSFGGTPDAEAFAVVAGGRIGIGFVIEPSAFIHAGIGHIGYDTAVGDYSRTSLAYEGGLALDLTLLPVIDIGAHATLAGIAGDADEDAFSWLAIGGHVSFNF